MDDTTIQTEEVSLNNNNSVVNNIPVHISSRHGPISPAQISPGDEEEARKNSKVDHNNCQVYTEIVNVSEEYGKNNRMIARNSYDQNNVVLRELSTTTPTGLRKSDSEFTEEEDQDGSKSLLTSSSSSSRTEEDDQQYQQNAADISQSFFFNHDGLIEKGIIKIITRPADTGPGEDSSCYDTSCSHGGLSLTSVDSSCCNNDIDNIDNSDKENLSPFPELHSSTISTPTTYKHVDGDPTTTAPKTCPEEDPGVVEMVDSQPQCLNIKKEVLSQNSYIYEENLDSSNSIYSSKMSTTVSSSFNITSTTNTSGEMDNTNSSSSLMMLPDSFDTTTRVFSGHNNSSLLNSSSLESDSFASETPMRTLESEEVSPGISSQKHDFSSSSPCFAPCGQNNSTLDLVFGGLNNNNNKDIPSGFIKNTLNATNNISVVDSSLNSKKCMEDFRNNENDNTFSSSPTSSSCDESSPFTSILGNDSSRYQDQMNATRLLGCCQEYDKETPRSLLSRMQGVDLFIKQSPFLKAPDMRQSHMTSTPMYKQQKLQESLMEMPSSHSGHSQKSSSHILHTPHPKHGQLIYCHSILDNSTDFQPKTPTSGPILNSSGEENNSPPDEYMPCTNASFSTQDNEERISLACLKSDLCDEDDPIRHQHNLNERKRRARITIACDLMRRLVPGLSDKTDQATVFEYAARYIHFLQTQVGNKYNRPNTPGRYSLQPPQK